MGHGRALQIARVIATAALAGCGNSSSPMVGASSAAAAPSSGVSAAAAGGAGSIQTVGTAGTGGRPMAAGSAAESGGTGVSGTSSGRGGSAAAPVSGSAVAGAAGAGTSGSTAGGPPAAGTSGSAAAPAAGAGAAPAAGRSVEDDHGDCATAMLPEPGSLPAVAKLPDPFTKLDGARIASKADWHCRQAEIRAQAERYAFGQKPAKPENVSGTITNTSITVNVMNGGKRTMFSAAVVLPRSGTPPYPAIVVYGGLGLGFGVPLDTSVIDAKGIALINYDVGVTGKEGTPRNNKQGAFYDIEGSGSATGLLMAWGWGVSRMIDVIEQSDGKLLKADAIGVTGCSRFGKGAFVAGAFDQRIQLTMPIESGTGGVPIWRGIAQEGAQSLSSAYGEQPWFGDAFSAFTSNAAKAPIDTHEIIGLVAPRGLFIMDNPAIANLGPKAAHVAALAGAEIYKALGAGENITYFSAVQNGSHCSMRPEWSAPFQNNVEKFLTKTGSAPGVIKPAVSAMGDVSSWVDWTAPSLN